MIEITLNNTENSTSNLHFEIHPTDRPKSKMLIAQRRNAADCRCVYNPPEFDFPAGKPSSGIQLDGDSENGPGNEIPIGGDIILMGNAGKRGLTSAL